VSAPSSADRAVLVEPVTRLVGHIAVPGDKSISHRAVLIGALCDGETRVTGFGRSADTESTIAVVRALGVDVYEHGDDTLRVFGKGLGGTTAPGTPLDCGNAGTLVRLLSGILAGQLGDTFTVTGDESLSARPMGRIAEPLGRMGAQIETTDGHLPMTVRGRALRGIDYVLPVASAQVKSAILLAGLYADGETTVVEPSPTRDHTERMLIAAGADVSIRPRSVSIRPADRLLLSSPRPSCPAPSSTCTTSTSTRGAPGCSRSSSGWARGSRSTTGGRSAASLPGISRSSPRLSSGHA
jgi:3-phosphoshikimate 1-carboxyvinyltransferase